jgi:hypothetical protein
MTRARRESGHPTPERRRSPAGTRLALPEAWFPRRPSEGGIRMNTLKAVALVLIVAGVLALVYGGFTYTKTSHDTKIGPLELSIKDKETVNIPIWAGVGAVVVGGVLLFVGPKK